MNEANLKSLGRHNTDVQTQTINLKGEPRVNTSLSEKLHFYILIFSQKIIFLKNLCFSPLELSGTNI